MSGMQKDTDGVKGMVVWSPLEVTCRHWHETRAWPWALRAGILTTAVGEAGQGAGGGGPRVLCLHLAALPFGCA